MEKEYLTKLVEVEQRSKSNTKRLDEHEEQIKELSNVYVALTKVDDKVSNVENDVSEMKKDLKDIKEKFRKKNIIINGDVDIESIRKIKGVNEVEENALDIIVRIDNQDVAPKVFKEVSKSKNIIKYALEEPTLNEIFVAKVGESY